MYTLLLAKIMVIFIVNDKIKLQALARLRFSETVAQSDVDEALRLMQMSKFSLYSDDRQRSGLDAISDIYSILRDEAARSNKMDVSYAQALNRISRMVSFLFIIFILVSYWFDVLFYLFLWVV